MIELLILYSLSKREKTAYSIRKDIIEFFGNLSEPSFGTVHPALKRLEKGEFVLSKPDFSDGGRKSTYFSITSKGKSYAKKIFQSELSNNPAVFKTQLLSRISAISLLNKEEKEEFLKHAQDRLEIFKANLEKTIKDEYIGLDDYQKKLHEKALKEIKDDIAFVKELEKC